MEIFLDRLFAGLTDGSIYTMIALSLVVVFRSTKTLNFAQGEFALFTCFLVWWLQTKGVPAVLALLIGIAVGFAMGVVAERALVRPVRRRDESAVLIVCLGLFIALNGADGWIWGPADKPFPELLPHGKSDYVTVFGARLQYDTIGIIVAMLLVVALLTTLFNRTKLGLQMRAVASNSESASLSGVKVGRVLSASWGLSCAIGSFAGVLLVPVVPPNDLDLGQFFPILIFASAAALLGGLDSVRGAVLGGLVLGIGETMLNGYVPSLGTLHLTVALVIIVVVLVFKPTGVFGARIVGRV